MKSNKLAIIILLIIAIATADFLTYPERYLGKMNASLFTLNPIFTFQQLKADAEINNEKKTIFCT
ncbi:MAG: hypothetical protein ABH956_00810 [Candidatus Nealsonbacteria bacterium]